ncbi:MAG: DNA-binding protein [Anaeromyxobacter sp. RBG_16_69_14]|nr:MAG: DNA-binding protein [Anaeromyxobacter sp. RBG_16_69_14]
MRTRPLLAAAALLAAFPALAAKKPLATGERVDLNRASVVELMRLPGVGRKKAEAIAAHRSRTPFRRIDDVLAVRGFSSRWLEKQRAHLSVGPAASAPVAAKPAPARVRPQGAARP